MKRTTMLAALLAGSIATPATADHSGGGWGPAEVNGGTIGDPLAGWPTFLIAQSNTLAFAPPPGNAAMTRELEVLRRQIAERAPDLVAKVRRWEAGGGAYRWNQQVVADLVDRFVLVHAASRTLSLLHAALHDATVSVAAARAIHPRASPAMMDPTLALAGTRPVASSYPSEAAAVGEAAALILAALIPDRAEAYRAMATESVVVRQQAGLEFPSDAEAGRAIGAAIAALALERARADGFDAHFTGTIPTGPGRWVGTTPFAPLAGTWKPFVLASGDALRPSPPPAHDSPQGKAALAEVRNYARTPKANHDSVYWEVYGGARSYQLYNNLLGRLVLENDLGANPLRAAAAYAAVNVAVFDSFVACFDAKYTYWYARPHHLDPDLRTVHAVPSHPAYPSAHSCLTVAATGVMAKFFPADAAMLTEMGRRAGEARIAAGIHYRFDVEAGNAIGRGVAELVAARMAPAMR
jgi:hypothetical protein